MWRPTTFQPPHPRLAVFLAAALFLTMAAQAPAQFYGAYATNPIWGGGYPDAMANVYWPGVNFGTFYGWNTPNFSWNTPNFGWWPPFTGWSPPYANPLADYQAEALWSAQAASDLALAEPTFNVWNMSASTNADAGNLIASSFQAIARANANNPQTPAAHADRYNVRSARPWSAGTTSTARLVDITSRDGDILWPLSAPSDGDLADKRRAASDGVKSTVQEFRAGGGKVSLRSASDAIKRLQLYSEPAIDHLRASNPQEVRGFINFVRSLDRGVRLLVGKDAEQLPPLKAIRPTDAPKP